MKRFRATFLIIAFVALAAPAARAVEVVAAASGNWSSTTTWTGGLLPGIDDDVKIPTGLTVTLNANVECGGIVVEGKLAVERADRTLLCDYLIVQTAGAVFEVGTSASRFLQNFTLTLKGLSTEPAPVMGAKVLGAHNGGTLEIHGRDRIEWTHLGANAAAGATSLTLVEPVDWAAGDSILVTSSRASWNEAETRTITAVSPDLRTVSFTPGLTYLHNGSTLTKTRSTDGKSWTANLRAEVGLLSRNVKIQGDAASETAGFGGHIMVMNGGTTCCVTNGRAFIEGAELFRMGQKSIVGRYPMHWHMVAEGGVGQYFRDNVVRRSFNRAITIHGTESTLVENNFCYDHIGHGIFLEDGSERFNVIRKNVVALSKKPAVGEEILETDNAFNAPQNRSPSSYWITNPNNTFTDNVAAGTQGTGFWFAFPQKPLGPSLTHPRFAAMEPHKQPLGAFDRNTAHSCMLGLDINDQVSASDTLIANGEWANNGPFYFNDCTWYCNDNAIYAGIGGRRKNVVYWNNVFSDNEINLFLATYQLCEESLMVADSGFGLQPAGATRTVYAVYDGAGRMKKNHLVGYHATNARFLQNIGAAIKHPNHSFEGLTFDPPTPVRSVLTNYNIIPPADIGANDPGHPRIWAQVVVDVDGSISGVPNSSLVSNHPFLLTGAETRPSVWTNMYRSDHRFAQCRLEYGIPFGSIPNVSVVRTKAGSPTRGVYYINGYNEWHQLPLIVREDFLYTYSYETLPSTRRVDVKLDDAVVGDDFVVRFKDFGKLPGIAVTGMTSRASLAELKSGTTSGFFKETDGDFYIRPVATATQHTYTITWTSNVTIPVVDSDGDGVSDGAEAAAGTDPFRAVDGTEPFVDSEFNVTGNFEDWGAFAGIGSEAVTGGVLAGQTTSTNPQMIESNLRVSGSAVPYLLVRMKASQNGNAEMLWGRLGATTYTASRTVTVNYNGGNQWRVLAFPMQANAEWQGQIITNLRFDPTTVSGVQFEVDWIRASDGNFISTVPAQTILEDTATAALDFTLSADIADYTSFTVTGTSSNTALVPNANIVIAGSGENRTVTVTPAPNMNGTATITLTVSDGTLTSASSFLLTVNGVVDAAIKAATGSTLNAASAWTGAFVPVAPDTATWNAASLAGAMTLGSNLNWAGLIVNDPAGPLTFNGTQTLTLGSAGLNLSAATVNLTLNHPVTLGENQTWNVGAGRTLAANGQISGARSLTKSGTGSVILAGANSFSGNVNISAGSATITNSLGLGTGAKTVGIYNGSAGACELHLDGSAGPIALAATMTFNTSRVTGNGAIVNDAGHNTIGGPISMISGGGNTLITVLGGSLALNGNITSNFTSGRTLQLAGVGSNAVNGIIRDGSGIASVLVQSGTWTLSNANTNTGTNIVSGGTLALGGSLAGPVTVNGGTFAPQGLPAAASDFALNAGGTFQARVNGATAGAQYDQFAAGGTVTLAGPLELVAGPGLAAGASFRILNKTSTGAISGTFSGKPESSVFTEDGYPWIISYVGGDGNDVVVTLATPVQAWRFQYFGTIENSGAAADTFDANGDGEVNLLEFATGQNPHAASLVVLSATRSASALELTYTRSKEALTGGMIFAVEWSDTLAPNSWFVTGVTQAIVTDNGTLQSVKATVPTAAAIPKRFARLKVTSP
jgi:autotransporter-associated beta strand protein